MSLRPLKHDLSVFQKIGFERQPVGINYEYFKPQGVEQLDTHFSLCEMVRVAQERGTPFYITKDNEDCAGKCALGMMEGPAWGEGGEIGERMDIFQCGRANQHCVSHYKTIRPGQVNFAVFSPLDKLAFEPDLLTFVGTVEQCELILRAMTYSTGEMYESKSTIVFQCSWLYTYPYLTQKINYVITGLSFGMKAREVFPSGLVIVSVPWNWIPTIAENLQEMKFVLPAWTLGKKDWTAMETKILKSIEAKADEEGLGKKSPFTSFQ